MDGDAAMDLGKRRGDGRGGGGHRAEAWRIERGAASGRVFPLDPDQPAMRLLPLALALLAAPAGAAAPIAGRWITAEGDSIVTLGPCGSKTCGRITAFLRKPDPPNPTDRNNPDPALRARPIMGMAVLYDFADAGRDWRGRIYDPRSGKSYKSILSRQADGTLKVQGCIAVFCRTQVWRRAG